MGQIIGAVVGIWIFSSIFEWAIFKRVLDDPLKGKVVSVLAAWLFVSTVWGFASANGGGFRTDGFMIYALGAIPSGIWAVRRGKQLREEQTDDGLRDIFS